MLECMKNYIELLKTILEKFRGRGRGPRKIYSMRLAVILIPFHI